VYRSNQIQGAALISAISASLVALATLLVATASAAGTSIDEIEARVRQIYIEGYPVATDGRLDSVAVERLGEMLRDPSEQPYWSNIVLALGASEDAGAYRHLADFAANPPSGEASSGEYQARVALPVALGHLAHSHPQALGLIKQLARDERSEPGWRFQSLDGSTLAGSLRQSAITGLAVAGSPESAAVLRELEARAKQRSQATTGPGVRESDELLQHLEFARTLHGQVASRGVNRALEHKPVAK
jgi:hypothetical protein